MGMLSDEYVKIIEDKFFNESITNKKEDVANVDEAKARVSQRQLEEAVLGEIDDSDWVCSVFMVSNDADWDYEHERRYYTSAVRKVGGSGLGDGRVLNMPPGINEFADIPVGFGISGNEDGSGMGVHYSEGLDDNLDIIHIRPGVPRYSSLARFYLNAVNSDAVRTNEYGWFDATINAITSATGYMLTLPFKIILSPFSLVGRLLSNDNTNRYSYYYLAPATHAYWMTLENIVNDFAIRSGLIPGASFDGQYDDGSLSTKIMSGADMDYFIQNMPGVYRDTIGFARIDVLAISARHALLTARRNEYLAKQLSTLNGQELNDEYIETWSTLMLNHNPYGDDVSVRSLEGVKNLGDALAGTSAAMAKNYTKIVHSNLSTTIDEAGTTHTTTVNDDGTVNTEEVTPAVASSKLAPELDDADFASNFKQIVSAGADWISLAVDHVTETKVSIQNNSGPSGLASSINGMVSTMRGANFNIAGGNIGDGAIANMAEGLITTGKAAIGGLTSSFLGAMPGAILGGKAFIDIPDVYQDSTLEFNSMNFSLTSISTSGHPLAKLRMLMPYFALVALAAPRSGGPSSYTPPYLVEVQQKGRGIVQLGMIDSLNATFGDEDGWDINDIPNQVSIDFSVVNLNKGFHIPVDPTLSLTYADTGEFALHMSVLAGTSLTDRDKSLWYNAKRSAMTISQKFDRAFSATYWAHLTGTITRDTLGGPLAMMGLYTNRR